MSDVQESQYRAANFTGTLPYLIGCVLRNQEVAKATTSKDSEQQRRRQHELAIPIHLSVFTDGVAAAEVNVKVLALCTRTEEEGGVL